MHFLYRALVTGAATGATTHTRDGRPVEAPSALAIGQHDGDPGVYLFYLDATGRELTDTYHETIEQAMDQAEFEFGLMRGSWWHS